jgi:hypothetical protein
LNQAEKTAVLSEWQGALMLHPRDVFQCLSREKITYIVVGCYGIQEWLKEPRATQDTDLLAPKPMQAKARASLLHAWPELTVRDSPVVTRFLLDGAAVVDLIKPYHAVFKKALKETAQATLFGEKVRIPTLEMSLALKYFSMVSLGRQDADKHQDAHDFIQMVRKNRQEAVDLEKVGELGETCFPGGGADLLRMIERARAGQPLEI